ncbi:3-phosphoshikimate 1-carboxyvinyltransferase [Flaviaesturariibacter flavus]|uniref:3-phosphoshikimate 1-carboxyvinyltransferase n=1 Tax=Flaviaesturariibacter flavus TaxID=2502780 RepID=A0A4R1BJB8_9BACT|nr:3-phosphoshikimate 1-carboxyvinyltransferase [Flaviaesturariibacter flavus]TCJ17420.1 3-phosphoshikimate 1-carboxyvinyltransferase [Flaviaesturariibacter flavus]
MNATVSPSTVSGTYVPPASKSAMQRACAAALLRSGTTILHNPGNSEDDRAALDLVTRLGAHVAKDESTITITSRGVQPKEGQLHCGESGLSVRMFTPIAALSSQELTITGSGSLTARPLDFFDTVLPQIGVRGGSTAGKLPLHVQGPLQPADITIDGSLSSQFLTGLLMAYSAAGARGVALTVKGLNSRPYIDLTLAVMRDFGMKVPRNDNYESFVFGDSVPTPAKDPLHYTVQGDWSGAAFGLVAGAIAGKLEVTGLDVFSEQADKAILRALMQTNVALSIREDGISVGGQAGGGGLNPFHFNATDCPDLFPPLVALASCCAGTSVIEGVHRLAHKESNRALTLQDEFGKLGLSVELQDDLMIVRGGTVLRGAAVSARHDHRIAMALGVAALRADGPVTIEGAEAVGKSYPQFWAHLQQLGASVSLTG